VQINYERDRRPNPKGKVIVSDLRTFLGLWARRVTKEVLKFFGQFSFVLFHGLLIEPEIIRRDAMLENFVLIFFFD
jgi:hypothetical protein